MTKVGVGSITVAVVGVGLAAAALLAVGLPLYEQDRATIRFAVGAALVGVLVWAFILRPRIILRTDGTVLLRNVFSTWTVPLAGVETVAVGAISGAHGIEVADALAAFLQAFAANLVQASIRLGVTGQDRAVQTVAALETRVLTIAARAAHSTLDDLGSAAVLSDIMSMKHETQYSRLFRS